MKRSVGNFYRTCPIHNIASIVAEEKYSRDNPWKVEYGFFTIHPLIDVRVLNSELLRGLYA